MSIIGHSIQNSLANVHAAIKEQQAGQAAQSDEEAKRRVRMAREEELAREAVRESHESAGGRISDDAARKDRPREGSGKGEESGTEGDGESEGHIDLFA